jgi:hypothetical protein
MLLEVIYQTFACFYLKSHKLESISWSFLPFNLHSLHKKAEIRFGFRLSLCGMKKIKKRAIKIRDRNQCNRSC